METTATDHTPSDATIVKTAIYPSIGVARVGNSPTEWYLGPEVPDPLPLPAGSYRDNTGALKREAARFRIYGLNAAGDDRTRIDLCRRHDSLDGEVGEQKSRLVRLSARAGYP